MGIDLHWENENGNHVAELPDHDDLVGRILPDYTDVAFPCLRFVDPHGDTVFNQLQIPQLVAELEVLLLREHDSATCQHLLAILEFTQQLHGVHMYLRFYGD